jgi:opacity protein-like surface antigen
MKRNIFVALLVFLALGGFLLAKEDTIIKVKVQSANVRSGPEAAAAVIAKLPSGTLLEVSGREGAWYEVSVNDPNGKAVTGYIHNSVVEVLSDEEEEEEARRPAARRETPKMRPAKAFAAGGVKLMGGLSMGNLTFSEPLSAEVKKTSKMGFMGGLGFESGGRIAFELDLLYSPGGAVFKDAVDTASKERITISGTAVTAPIMVKIRFMPGTTPYVLAGGEIGYILSQKVVVTDAAGTDTEVDITDEINRLLYGVVFGGGVEMQVGGMNLLLEARYRIGLSNLIKDAEPGTSVKATALSILLGVKF